MTQPALRLTGGCLCGALRYLAGGEPLYAGFCYCRDCQRASGSAFIPFIGYAAGAVTITGEARQYRSTSFRGGESVRNFCPICGGLVFGGVAGRDESHTLYAGTLDEPSAFRPQMAIFTRDRPGWAPLPEGIVHFETMPD
jgi:hypothetical protein